MKNLIIHPTDISQWYALVNEAQLASHLNLNENTESYLVFLLQRFSHAPQLMDAVVAHDFLKALQCPVRQKIDQLREVGDKSLLLCGLFPGMAARRHVTVEYYSNMGQTAYLTISEFQDTQSSELFLQLSQHFGVLQKILQSIRGDFYQFNTQSTGAIWIESDAQTH